MNIFYCRVPRQEALRARKIKSIDQLEYISVFNTVLKNIIFLLSFCFSSYSSNATDKKLTLEITISDTLKNLSDCKVFVVLSNLGQDTLSLNSDYFHTNTSLYWPYFIERTQVFPRYFTVVSVINDQNYQLHKSLLFCNEIDLCSECSYLELEPTNVLVPPNEQLKFTLNAKDFSLLSHGKYYLQILFIKALSVSEMEVTASNKISFYVGGVSISYPEE